MRSPTLKINAAFLQKEKLLWWAYAMAAFAVSTQSLWQRVNRHGYTAYENYVIFKNAFPHLVQGLNPYMAFPAEQWDLYKYSPAFAMAMAPFAALPDWLGLQLWNLLNALPLLWALLRLPVLLPERRPWLAWFVLPELVISMQNSQSNGITAALILGVFIAMERGKPIRAAGWAAAGGFLKIFGIFAAAPALVYIRRRRFALALIAWSALLLVAPLVLLTADQLRQVYGWWYALLQTDHSRSVGLSVQGWLLSWFAWDIPKGWITASGLLLLGASTFAVYRQPAPAHRILLWASLLLWVVIFNHKAESPTFVIAMCGVGMWYWQSAENRPWKTILFWTAFACASLTPTDIFPRAIRTQIVQPFVLKAVPCIIIWIAISVQLLHTLLTKQQLTSDEQ